MTDDFEFGAHDTVPFLQQDVRSAATYNRPVLYLSHDLGLQMVVGAPQRLEILFNAMAEAGLWERGGAAPAAMAALRRGLLHDHQLHAAYLALAHHVLALPADQQPVPVTPPPPLLPTNPHRHGRHRQHCASSD